LLSEDNEPFFCDFGLSHKMGNMIEETGGSFSYIAPEVAHAIVRLGEFESRTDISMTPHQILNLFVEATNPPQDVFSLGVVFKEMNDPTQKQISDDQLILKKADLYEKVRNSNSTPNSLDHETDFESLIIRMMDPNPKTRITVHGAIKMLNQVMIRESQIRRLEEWIDDIVD
jgi:serine/threonine protein kinase